MLRDLSNLLEAHRADPTAPLQLLLQVSCTDDVASALDELARSNELNLLADRLATAFCNGTVSVVK